MGIFDAVKKSRRAVNRENQEQGREGERRAMAKYELAGYKVQRTGHGHDFKATKRDPFTSRADTKYVEAKTGDSSLSPLQKKKKRQLGKKYVVEREYTTTEALRTMSSRKKSSGGWFGAGTAPKTAKSRKSSGGLQGTSRSSVSLFGSSKTRKTKKSRKSRGGLL